MHATRVLALASLTLSATLAAHADSFAFNYTGMDITASGILSGESTGTAGVYDITGITGTRNGAAISGLDKLDPFADQLLYFPATDTGTQLNPTYLDNSGIAFLVGGVDYNIFTSDVRETVVENDLGPAIKLTVSAATTVTPEPSTLALLGTGILGLAAAARRRLERS